MGKTFFSLSLSPGRISISIFINVVVARSQHGTNGINYTLPFSLSPPGEKEEEGKGRRRESQERAEEERGKGGG